MLQAQIKNGTTLFRSRMVWNGNASSALCSFASSYGRRMKWLKERNKAKKKTKWKCTANKDTHVNQIQWQPRHQQNSLMKTPFLFVFYSSYTLYFYSCFFLFAPSLFSCWCRNYVFAFSIIFNNSVISK